MFLIEQCSTADLATVLRGLVIAGLAFRVFPKEPGYWSITLTGGY